MAKTRDILRRANRLVAGTVLLTAGILLLLTKGNIAVSTAFLLGMFMLAHSVYGIVSYLTARRRSRRSLVWAGLSLLGGILLTAFQSISFTLLVFLFAGYLLLISIIKGIDAVLVFHDRAEGFWLSLLTSLLYLVFAVLLVAMPEYQASTLYLISAVVFLVFGSIFLLDCITASIPVHAKNKLKARVRIALPVIVAALIPYTVQRRVNEYINQGNERNFDSNLDLNGDPDLIIYIHVAKKGFNAIGHCDVWFDGEILAYGSYDEPASSKIGIGPGVLLVSNKEEYVPYCLHFNHTTIFAFGLKLTEEQKQEIRQKVLEIKANTYPWDAPYQSYVKEGGEEKTAADFPDFPSHLMLNTDSSLYKFKEGRMKTYFVCTTNCVVLPDLLLGKASAGVLDFNGILSPGTLYDYLDTEYYKEDSFVISRDVYRYDDIKEKQYSYQ